jgi:glycosyltransferase involved in cell wall biosynthesis
MPRVSVIVPARDARATLPRALAAITGQDIAEPFEVIVVDDGSRDDTARIARAAGPPVEVVVQGAAGASGAGGAGGSGGPASARNAGVARARGTVLAFCDADVFPAPGWLAAGVTALAGADLVQGRVLPDPHAPLGPFDRTLWINGAVGLWETANLFVTRNAFDAAGGFEQWLAPRRGKALAEDVWFGYRALRAGARPAFCADAVAHHAVFPRGWRAYAAERARLRFFPAMTARMPELRRAFLYRRAFLNARTARLDLALAAALIAVARRSPLSLAAAVPYARELRRHAHRAGAAGPKAPAPPPAVVAAADLCADLVGLAALAAGSVRYRAPVL